MNILTDVFNAFRIVLELSKERHSDFKKRVKKGVVEFSNIGSHECARFFG